MTDTSLLTKHQQQTLLSKISSWQIKNEETPILWREVECKNFKEVLDLVNKIGVLAEGEQHHPNLYLHSYKFLRIELHTHEVNGLSEKDFHLATKIDTLIP